MDIDGLAKLMEQNRDEMIRQFKDMKQHCCQVTKACNERMKAIENMVDEHSTSITRIKSIGIFVAFIWTTVVAAVSKYIWGE